MKGKDNVVDLDRFKQMVPAEGKQGGFALKRGMRIEIMGTAYEVIRVRPNKRVTLRFLGYVEMEAPRELQDVPRDKPE